MESSQPRMQLHIHTHTHSLSPPPPPHTHTHAHAHTHSLSPTHIHTHTHAHTNTCTHTHTHTHTHKHTHTHTDGTCTDTCACTQSDKDRDTDASDDYDVHTRGVQRWGSGNHVFTPTQTSYGKETFSLTFTFTIKVILGRSLMGLWSCGFRYGIGETRGGGGGVEEEKDVHFASSTSGQCAPVPQFFRSLCSTQLFSLSLSLSLSLSAHADTLSPTLSLSVSGQCDIVNLYYASIKLIQFLITIVPRVNSLNTHTACWLTQIAQCLHLKYKRKLKRKFMTWRKRSNCKLSVLSLTV